MLGLAKSDDYQPVGWVGRYPIHVATLLVILHVLTMIGMALAFGQDAPLRHFFFSSEAVLARAAAWQFLTYAFVNGPSLWFAVEMFLLFAFGREVEKYIGRSAFIVLYLTLLLLPPCLLTAIGVFAPTNLAGSGGLHFAIFIAFATLYPNVELLLSIRAKWLAWALLGIDTLQALAAHRWTLLLVLWLSAAAAFAFISRLRYGEDFSFAALWRKVHPAREQRLVPAPRNAPKKKVAEEDFLSEVDPLLEKISQLGLASLTPREREKLENASAALSKKTRR